MPDKVFDHFFPRNKKEWYGSRHSSVNYWGTGTISGENTSDAAPHGSASRARGEVQKSKAAA